MKRLQRLLLRVHRSFLVAVDRIEGVFERYPEIEEPESISREKGGAADECELTLRGTDARIPVTTTYSQDVKKALGVNSLHHLVPEYPDDKVLRLYELIDFGWRELYGLDPKDTAAVEAFRKLWTSGNSRGKDAELLSAVWRQRNQQTTGHQEHHYQMFRWIKKGIEPPSDGNIRSLWYK